MAGHQLILGKLTDRITGQVLDDTHDERYRQQLAHLLLDVKGFAAGDIEPRCRLTVRAGERTALVAVDFLVRVRDRVCMVVRYGPGSVVTRHRPALAVGRLVAAYQVPVIVVTNGRDADILDGRSGAVMGTGLEGIPSRRDILKRWDRYGFEPVDPRRAERESRIVYAYEVDGACPCDDSVCRIDGEPR